MAGSVRKVRLSGTDGVVRTGACRLVGFAVYESGGSDAAGVLIYDGTSAAGDVIPIKLSAGQSVGDFWPGSDGVLPGVLMETGIYADYTGTGTVAGVLFVLDGG